MAAADGAVRPGEGACSVRDPGAERAEASDGLAAAVAARRESGASAVLMSSAPAVRRSVDHRRGKADVKRGGGVPEDSGERGCTAQEGAGLGQDGLYHATSDIGQPEIAAIVAVRQAAVIEAKAVQDRRVQVVDVDLVADGGGA